jgi:hypothetical protein
VWRAFSAYFANNSILLLQTPYLSTCKLGKAFNLQALRLSSLHIRFYWGEDLSLWIASLVKNSISLMLFTKKKNL